MIIDKNIGKYLALDGDSIRHGLKKIESNEDGILFIVSEDGCLQGVLTDGDFRRWVISSSEFDIDQPLYKIMNRDFQFAYETDAEIKIQSLLSGSIEFLPLLDTQRRCVALARRRREAMVIGDRKIGLGNPAYLIAEIGNNHNGSLELARRLVDQAKAAGADCAKFQLRDLVTLYKNAGNSNDASEDLGTQYTLDLLSRFQLSVDDMFRVFDHCVRQGIQPLCTPWDLNSLQALERWGMPAYKVASADLTNHEFLEAMARTGKPIVCSTGMSTESEIVDAVNVLKRCGAQFALLHCNSTYPAPFKDLNLNYMKKLRSIGRCPVGYSSHDRGINISVAAISLGADIIEKHFTLDREMEGNDHRVSLLPGEFTEMVEAIRQVEVALGSDADRRLSQGEMMNREALGKSLVVNCDLPVGTVIEAHMIGICSPGRGMPPYRKREVVGKTVRRVLKCGEILFEADFSDTNVGPRAYSFSRPFGIPVRYHDMSTLGAASNFDLLEFHLSYKDMDEDIGKYFDKPLDMDLVVHAPELFEGDHVLDLCSLDPDYRRHSIAELTRVVAITLALRPYFKRAQRPKIIVNVGGFTQDTPLAPRQRAERYDMVIEALSRIDLDGVEILPQTMPPFPWHFGGQRYQNLFMDPDEIAEFCRAHSYRVCLDTSHSKLACNQHRWSFGEFIEKVGPYSAHLHIADASGVDGEGLQVGEGDIDHAAIGAMLRRVAPGASFIPEIWQGHKNGGEGFWIALERLEHFM